MQPPKCHLKPVRQEHTELFAAMEKHQDTQDYITPYTAERHLVEMAKNKIVYLSIHVGTKVVGFVILVLEKETASVELRRIVVAARGKGIGQAAMAETETYCKEELRCQRIWLDVFDFNKRGRHIYQKLGYQQFKSEMTDGKTLLFLEKHI